jgi:hypothetical protein
MSLALPVCFDWEKEDVKRAFPIQFEHHSFDLVAANAPVSMTMHIAHRR